MLVITNKINAIIRHCNFINLIKSVLACHLLPIKINYEAVMLHCGKWIATSWQVLSRAENYGNLKATVWSDGV